MDVDVAEFAGSGLTCKRSILDAYSGSRQHRSDNSFLKFWIDVTLLEGDPVFQRPVTSPAACSESMPLPVSSLSSNNTLSLRSGASGRAASSTSRPLSKSWTSERTDSSQQEGKQQEYNEALEATRVPVHQVIAEILCKFGFEMPADVGPDVSPMDALPDEEVAAMGGVMEQSRDEGREEEKREDVGLKLYVNKDGSTTLGSRSLDDRTTTLSSRSSRPDSLI